MGDGWRVTKDANVGTDMDEYTIRLHAIRFLAHLGASRGERAAPQEVVVDVELSLPARCLPARDRLRDVIDYDLIACCVVEEGVARPYRLLETYVARAVDRLLADTPARTVRVAATKRHVPTKYPVDAALVELVASRRIP